MPAEDVAPCKICVYAIGNINGLCESCHDICDRWRQWIKSPQDEIHALSFWKWPLPPFVLALLPAILLFNLCVIASALIAYHLELAYPKLYVSKDVRSLLRSCQMVIALGIAWLIPGLVGARMYDALNPLEQRRWRAFFISMCLIPILILVVEIVVGKVVWGLDLDTLGPPLFFRILDVFLGDAPPFFRAITGFIALSIVVCVLLAPPALCITKFLDSKYFRREAQLAIRHVLSTGRTQPVTAPDEGQK